MSSNGYCTWRIPSLKNDIIPETLQRLHIRLHFCQSLLTCGKNGGDFCACRWFRLGKKLQKPVFWVVDTHFLGPTQKLLPLVVDQLGGSQLSVVIPVVGAQFAQTKRCFKTTRAVCTVFLCTMLIYVIHNIYIYTYIYTCMYTYILWTYLYIHIMFTKCISNLPLPTSPLTPAPRPNVFLQQHRIATAAPSVANLPLEPVTFLQRWERSAKTDPQTSKVNSRGIKIILLMVQKSQTTTVWMWKKPL